MKRAVKLAISAVFFAVTTLADALRRMLGGKSAHYLVIIYYHAVPKAHAPSFARQMAQLARWAVVVPADWPGPDADTAWPARHPVAITFDDAFDSALDNALPILARHHFPCTIFAPSGWLGEAPGWAMETDADRAERVATPERLAALAPHLVTVGSHTVSHPKLTQIPQSDVVEELKRSLQDLHGLIHRPADLLAFPYGIYNGAVLDLCRSSGYRFVFTIEPRVVQPDQGNFARGRVGIDASDSPLEFFLKARGAYRWMPYASALKRRLRG